MDADKPISTKYVPARFLAPAMLIGHVPWRILQSEPRLSYGLYIPPQAYPAWATADAGADCDRSVDGKVNTEVEQPRGPTENEAGDEDEKKKLPVLVYIHGTRRSVPLLATSSDPIIAFAQSMPCAILAPLFPAGMDGPHDVDSYKLLRSETLRADLALLSILDEVAGIWPGIDVTRLFMMGFSGGGQFVQRFLYLYPERLKAVSVGAPGRATHLDEEQKWPGGIAGVEKMFDRKVNKSMISKVKIQLVVGEQDNQVHGGEEFWQWIAEMKGKAKARPKRQLESANCADEEGILERDESGLVPMRQGRLDTIRELQARWKEQGIEASLEIVPGMGHESMLARGAVLEFLGREILKSTTGIDNGPNS